MEESTAVQCPSVAYQLAGAKKVQQDLASPEVLQRFLDSDEDIKLASSCFAGTHSVSILPFHFPPSAERQVSKLLKRIAAAKLHVLAF